MVKYKKKINKGFVVMGKGERIGMLVLLSLIAILLAFSIFRPVIQLSSRDRKAFHNLDSLLAVQEAQRQAALAEMERQKQASETGTTAPSQSRDARTSHNSRKEKPKYESHASSPSMTPKTPTIEVMDLNVADSITLLALPQIGATMSSRIHRYRERLGGFVSLEQLYEVKGMDTARFEAIRPYIIIESQEIRKLHVNSDEFKVLLRHPYLEYEQVKAIVNHRERRGLITSWSQLQALIGDCNPWLERYIAY